MSLGAYPPLVYISENGGLAGNKATGDEQIGLPLPFADVVAKASLGILTWANKSVKWTVEETDLDWSVRGFGWSVATIPHCCVMLMLIVVVK